DGFGDFNMNFSGRSSAYGRGNGYGYGAPYYGYGAPYGYAPYGYAPVAPVAPAK
ncbi:MAG: sulfur globule family protein, partial [Sedimenticola sp.]